MAARKPQWLKKKVCLNNLNINSVKNLLEELDLHTVCQSAKCPNIFECFGKNTATFLLMGNICTRNCAFCGVESGTPLPLDINEPFNIASAAKKLGLHYIVLTSVTRDDLGDGGAAHFAGTVSMIKKEIPDSKVECLIPDFKGSTEDLNTLLSSEPDVLNHNIETIKKNYPAIRNDADYEVSLSVLRESKKIKPSIMTKSGFMVGLGESRKEIHTLLEDLRSVSCDILTIGQYLQPEEINHKVIKYYKPEEFLELKEEAIQMGFKFVASDVFVRSSYNASDVFRKPES